MKQTSKWMDFVSAGRMQPRFNRLFGGKYFGSKGRWIQAIRLLGVVALITCLQSCTKLGQLLSFNLNMQTTSVNFTMPVSTDTSSTITVGPVTTSFNVDSFIKANTSNQLGASNITSVKLTSVYLALNNATSASNFQDFASCSGSFYSNTDNTPYTISIPDNPDTYSSTLSLPVDGSVELKSYIGDQFTYSVTGRLRHPVPTPLNCTMTVTYSVAVKG